MKVPACRVALPQLDQRICQRTSVLVDNPAGDDDALAEWLTGVMAREIVVGLADRQMSEQRRREVREPARQLDHRLRRRAAHG
jgi:hypothetical protein